MPSLTKATEFVIWNPIIYPLLGLIGKCTYRFIARINIESSLLGTDTNTSTNQFSYQLAIKREWYWANDSYYLFYLNLFTNYT